MSDDLKAKAAAAALEEVVEGCALGIGTGSTAEAFVRLLAERVKDGLLVHGVATSQRTHDLCVELGIQISDLSRFPVLDLTVDGADELDGDLNLLKGGGGALLREKIVAAASRRMVVIADGSKKVNVLGAFPLPIEVLQFGIEPTRLAVGRMCRAHGMVGELVLRTVTVNEADAGPFETDEGHYILDASFGQIADPAGLGRDLLSVPGVVEHGLFIGLASTAYVARKDGVERIDRA